MELQKTAPATLAKTAGKTNKNTPKTQAEKIQSHPILEDRPLDSITIHRASMEGSSTCVNSIARTTL